MPVNSTTAAHSVPPRRRARLAVVAFLAILGPLFLAAPAAADHVTAQTCTGSAYWAGITATHVGFWDETVIGYEPPPPPQPTTGRAWYIVLTGFETICQTGGTQYDTWDIFNDASTGASTPGGGVSPDVVGELYVAVSGGNTVYPPNPIPQPCTLDNQSGCSTWDNGEVSEIGPDSGEAGWWNCKLETHCIVWTKDRPDVPPADPLDAREWTFGVGDIGTGLPPIWTKTYIVGWTCADQGPIFPSEPRTPSEGYADFHWGVQRDFFVACPVGQYIWNFYVLDVEAEGDTDYGAETVLFWGYGPPGSATPYTTQPTAPEAPTECGEDCTGTPPAAAPNPTYVAPPAPTTPATDPGPPSGDCDFGITDPSSWLCSLGGVFGQLLDAVKRIGSWLSGVPGMLLDLFVPDLADLQASFDSVGNAWDATPAAVIGGSLVDVAEPFTTIGSNPGGCAGPTISVAIPGTAGLNNLTPFSACTGLAATMSALILPILTALIYLGALVRCVRMLNSSFGNDSEVPVKA